MRIVNVKLGEIRKQKNPVVACIGYFDGILSFTVTNK